MTQWIPILTCSFTAISGLCTGEPIEGPPQPTYESCQRVLSNSVEIFRAEMVEKGLPEFGTPKFTDLFIGRKCERRG